MASKNLCFLGFKKPLKTSKDQNLGFLGYLIELFFLSNFKQIILNFIFYSWFVSFVIFLQKTLWQRELCIGCSSGVEILCSVLLIHWNL